MPGSGTPTGAGSPAAEDLEPDNTAVRLDPVADVPATAGHGEQTMTK
jgi:hypothetical protein